MNDNKAEQIIADATTKEMEDNGMQHGPNGAIAAATRCIVAAAGPLCASLFSDKVPSQDRLLFTLILTGACANFTVESHDAFHHGVECEVSVGPKMFQEALDVYQRMTGKDMSGGLPPGFTHAAERARKKLVH